MLRTDASPVENRPSLFQGAGFDLANALASHTELAARLFERAGRLHAWQSCCLSSHLILPWFANEWCHRTGRKATDRAGWLVLHERGFGCSVTLLAVLNRGVMDARTGRASTFRTRAC
jgi:hypothetical protein